jgi:hypothetical protein
LKFNYFLRFSGSHTISDIILEFLRLKLSSILDFFLRYVYTDCYGLNGVEKDPTTNNNFLEGNMASIDFLIVCGGAGSGLIGNFSQIAGELYLDVSKDIEEISDKLDSSFLSIKLDEVSNLNTPSAMLYYWQQVINEKNSSYSHPSMKNQIHDLFENCTSTENFSIGLSQNPTFGAYVIRHPDLSYKLERELKNLFTSKKIQGRGVDVDVWIVSSTAGGTGEGTYRFVAEKVVKYFSENEQSTKYTIHFLRIGSSSFLSCGQNVKLNTGIGILRDNAFAANMKDKFPGANLSFRYYYLDLPDVGSGPKVIPIRRRIISNTCKTIMLPELRASFNKVRSNVSMAVQTGSWGSDFDQDSIYLAVLSSLRNKLSKMIEGDVLEIQDKAGQPKFNPGVLAIEKRYKNFPAEQLLDARWRIEDFSKDPPTFDHYKKSIQKTIKSLSLFFNDSENWYEELDSKLEVDFFDSENKLKTSRFFSYGQFNDKEDRFSTIKQAIIVKGWAEKSLGFSEGKTIKNNGLLRDLINQIDSIKEIQSSRKFGPGDKADEIVKNHLPELLSKCVEIYIWMDEYEKANQVLKFGIPILESLLSKVIASQKSISIDKFPSNDQYEVIPAPLTKIMKSKQGISKTWFDLLVDASNDEKQSNNETFKEVVIKGASGLTVHGLRKLLNVEEDTPEEVMKRILCSTMGYFMSSKNDTNSEESMTEYEAQFWQGSPEPTMTDPKFSYRIFPELEPQLAESLGEGSEDGEVLFLRSNFDAVGFDILALKAGLISGTTIGTWKWYADSLVSEIKKCLTDEQWILKYQQDDLGRYRWMMACNFDEPIKQDFLKYLNFSEKEIERIGYYVRLF